MADDKPSPPDITHWTQQIHQGDAVETLRAMPESSVHCIVTSPPYYGMRDYGADGQIGLEESLDEYIQALVDVGHELRRVLRPDGNWWLNLGDSFAGSWGAQSKNVEEDNFPQRGHPDRNPASTTTLKRKNKMLVPHKVAIALQGTGWVVRVDAVWAKPNPIPHPVKDRLHEHKEYVFHLTREPSYWFDLDAIREPHADTSIERATRRNNGHAHSERQSVFNEETLAPEDFCHPDGKNPGDIFEVTVKPFPDAHFAVYPPELVEAPIEASCPPEVCAECGSPYDRLVEETPLWERDPDDVDRRQARVALERFQESDLTVEHLEAAQSVGFGDGDHGDATQGSLDRVPDRKRKLALEAKRVLKGYFREFVTAPDREFIGWEQACDCDTDATEAGIVLDPFPGAGTTYLVAKRLGRRFIGIDLNPTYVAMAQKRVGINVDEPELLLEDGETPITAYTDGGGRDG